MKKTPVADAPGSPAPTTMATRESVSDRSLSTNAMGCLMELIIPEPLATLIATCEVHCVAGCCGLEAYEVRGEYMIPWMERTSVRAGLQALAQLDTLIHRVRLVQGEVWSDELVFNARWDPQGCVEYLRGWREELLRALGAVSPSPLPKRFSR